jgi:BirA family biotin operon repressor/biotin-[acetyl-CoA-carboxylase] ligase
MTKQIQQNLIELVNILNDGEYHDGNTIGERLQLTRSAVWKAIKKLQNYGIKIDSVKGKGYLLQESLMLIDSTVIQSRIERDLEVIVFETIDSTNHYLKQFKNSKHPKICIAEQQTAGKGRFNREWHSPFGKNIYLSCLYPFEKDISELAGLSLLTSLSVVRTLIEMGVKNKLAVKWSNDIVFEGKKLAGNLIDVQAETHAGCQAIIGIGLNVNMLEDDGKITQHWTSVNHMLNEYIDRNLLCSSLINNLMKYLSKFELHGFEVFMDEWDTVDYLKDKDISLNIFNEQFVGKVMGINSQGYLLLQLPNGNVRVCSSGEASLVREGFVKTD